MKINAIIESKDGGTLVLDFPRSIYDVYEKLQSVGIRQSPHQITLSDEDGADVRVKLYSKDEVGKHLLLTLNEQNSLADANMLAFMVDNAKTDFRSKLEQNLLHDQYGSMQEVTDAIKQMLYESGPIKAVFYCPLVGEVTDDEGFSSPVDGRFLKSYAWAVKEALEADTADDEMDMAEFFHEDDGGKAFLGTLHVWSRCSFVDIEVDKLPIWKKRHRVLVLPDVVIQVIVVLRLIEITNIDSDTVMTFRAWLFVSD